MRTRLILSTLLFLFILVRPANAQNPIYLPIIEASMIKPLRSTLGITLPLESQNYVLNPSAESPDNFTAIGTAIIATDTSVQKYGLKSYSIQMLANGDGIELDLLALDNTSYYFTARLRTINQNVDITFTIGSTSKPAKLLEKIDTEWSLYGAIFTSSESNGQVTAEITLSASSGTPGIWADGLQIEPLIDGNEYSTYIDGTQEGCRWLGAPHASASTRSGDSRAGGVVTSFWEEFNFFPEKALGLSTAVEELNIDSYAFLPGGELNSSKIPPREFTLIGYFLADTVEELHEHAQRMELELGLNTYPGRQPIRLRYSGARVLKEISANYTGGLEGDLPIFYNDDWSQEDEAWVKNYKFRMKAPIGFVSLDPFWYEVGESATLLDTNDTATFETVAARPIDDLTWNNMGPPDPAGTYASVRTIIEDDIYLYLGGSFLNFDNIAAGDGMIRRNKQTGVYSAMGTGLASGTIPSPGTMALASNGDLYVGGSDITSFGGVANTGNIARWDGAWNSITPAGSPNGAVNALTFGPTGLLYATGSFTTINAVAANRVAVYDPATGVWSALSTGLAGAGFALAINNQTGLVYIGHADAALGYISVWDGSTITEVGNGELDNAVRALVIAQNGLLYMGGQFTGGAAVWNGSIIQILGSGVNNTVFSLALGPDNTLFLSGAFTQAGDIVLADRLAGWNGYTYFHLDIDLPGAAQAFAIYPSEYDIDSFVPQNYTLYLGFNTSGSAFYSGLVTSSNQGTIPAFPLIVFHRSGGTTATIQTLRNERTGRELLFNYALLDGETLTINLNPKNRSIISSFFGPRMSAILANSDFSTWQLLPGSNSVSSFVSESGSPTVIAYLLWREPYRGWN